MIGISLSTNIIKERDLNQAENVLLEYFNGSDNMLEALRQKGVSHIELRNFVKDKPYNINLLANKLWDMGFSISIHAKIVEGYTFEEYYKEFLNVFLKFGEHQNHIILTIHALCGNDLDIDVYADRTVKILNDWGVQREDK